MLAVQLVDALGFGDVRQCALKVDEAMEDDAAIDIGIRQAGSEVDRDAEIRQREMKFSAAIGPQPAFAIIRNVPGAVVAGRGSKGVRGSCVIDNRSGRVRL